MKKERMHRIAGSVTAGAMGGLGSSLFLTHSGSHPYWFVILVIAFIVFAFTEQSNHLNQ